jgi:hypothetical protein
VIGETNSEAGILAYTKLQTMLFEVHDIPYIPVHPVENLDDLPTLLASLRKPPRKNQTPHRSESRSTSTTAFELLKSCTANPPMPLQTTYYLSDLFIDFSDLAKACTSDAALIVTSMSVDDEGSTENIDNETRRADERMTRLRDLVGPEEYRDLVDFWTEEWIAE